MSTFWLALEESRRHGRSVVFAAAVGALTLFLPVVDVPLLARVTACTCAALAGCRLFAPDLLAGRLAFLLTMPISTRSLFLGRVLGAWSAAAAAAAVILLPASLRSGSAAPTQDLAGALGISFLVLVLANAAAIAVRTRTAWLGVDAVLLVLTAIPVTMACRKLPPAGELTSAAIAFAFLVALALAAAGLASVSAGRTNPLRAHGALSLTLWAMLLPAALVFYAIT